MQLEKTVDLMLSDDYKERFKAEYHQTTYRRNKLNAKIKTMKKSDPSYFLMRWQLRVLDDYIYILKLRAENEKISLK